MTVLLNCRRSQGDVGSNHEVPGLHQLHNLVIGYIKPGAHNHRTDKG